MNDFKKNEMRERLETMPSTIFQKQLDLMKETDKYEELLHKQKSIEQSIYFDVESAEEDGKKIFSNEIKRKAEVEKRLKNNSEYIELKESIKKKGKDIEREKLGISYLKRQLRATEAIINIELTM